METTPEHQVDGSVAAQNAVTRAVIPVAQLAALVVYLVLGYLYGVSGLVVPGVYLFLLWAAWGALLVVGISRRHDWRYLVGVPVLAALVWIAVVLGLGSLLDWQA